ncbi:uncharacterized protein VTP21DRAFT_4946 [Calcarisporiella thermophila]|uniref:uncharacterized protein n=1 Tax=Calcarisporiella thermophila TaxID=911321 RepID=UPI0037430D12
MSFQNLVNGGPECSGSNPLLQLTKQFNDDKSLQRERYLAGPSQRGPTTIRTGAPSVQIDRDKEFVNEFLEHQGPVDSFRFNEIRDQLDAVRLEERESALIHRPGGWADEFSTHQMPVWELGPGGHAEMEEAFKRYEAQPHAWREEFANHTVDHTGPLPQEFEEAFQKHFDWAQEYALAKDKGKLREDAWEDQFAAAERGDLDEDAIAKKIDEAAAEEDKKFLDNFESVWQNIQGDESEDEWLDPKKWGEEFARLSNEASLEGPAVGEYEFEQDNPYLNHPDPFSEGLKLMEANGGSLSEAAMAFEAAVQRDMHNAEAWGWLGNAQAQNEKEIPAIRALERAVQEDENNTTALMTLAVSYTNEGYDHRAYLTLERWLRAKYPHLITEPVQPPTSSFETHARVTDMFLQAARSGEQMDPEVQVGLGVLFYGSADYDKAVDCFVAALRGRPNDYLLWNRLGATLANSGRSEDAIEAYHKALDIKPTFVRARYNLGVSCINIGCYHEAAEHLLAALSMHQTECSHGGRGVNISENLWQTLRKAFLMMNRKDLADAAVSGADLGQFKGEFEF